MIAGLANMIWPYSDESDDEGKWINKIRSEYQDIDKLLSLTGSRAQTFDNYLSEVAPKSRVLLQQDNQQVGQDISRFWDVKSIIDRAERLHEDAKKVKNRLEKQTMRIKAASLVKQAEARVPELKKLLSQRYPELKRELGIRMDNALHYLRYELERFLKKSPSQVQQHEEADNEVLRPDGQSPLDGFLGHG